MHGTTALWKAPRPLVYLATAGALACSGCAREVYPVSGKVLYKGEPASGAAVFFHRRGADPAHEPMTMGIVKDDGSFTVVCGSLGEGAPPGEYDVTVEWKQPRKQSKGPLQHAPGHPSVKAPDRLKGRYADPGQSRLHAVVKAQTNALPPFELE
jgi:hypothetical protein